MNKNAVKVGEKMSFKDDNGVHTGVVVSTDAEGHTVIGSIVPAIAGSSTIQKGAAELTAA